MDDDLLPILRCPRTKSELVRVGDSLVNASGHHYRLVDGVPALFTAESLFQAEDSMRLEAAGFSPKLQRMMGKLLPPLDANLGSGRAFETVFANTKSDGRCLIVGAGDNPAMNEKLSRYFSRITITDVVRGAGTNVICDGHDLPFCDDAFDAVIAVAVLEHVLSPERVVAEMTRVLKKGGVVYADTAFMQQVHMGRFDFARFTELGHRWLFRYYEQLFRSSAAGPGSTLAWSISYFALSFVGKNRIARLLTRAIVRLLFFWLHWFDRLLVSAPSARDSASGVIFVGRNQKGPVLTPRELIGEYVGGF
jgi:SAM-dependent methyltransferase